MGPQTRFVQCPEGELQKRKEARDGGYSRDRRDASRGGSRDGGEEGGGPPDSDWLTRSDICGFEQMGSAVVQ